ncbi:hypothetical protein B0H19DRAFT_702510 [Mycena capillaripes]|nr:hypothetical protein B0H19DRAFT_702510 [Mycena capillaripes]
MFPLDMRHQVCHLRSSLKRPASLVETRPHAARAYSLVLSGLLPMWVRFQREWVTSDYRPWATPSCPEFSPTSKRGSFYSSPAYERRRCCTRPAVDHGSPSTFTPAVTVTRNDQGRLCRQQPVQMNQGFTRQFEPLNIRR